MLNETRKWLLTLPWEIARRAMYNGRCSQEDWEWFQHVWRNGVFRYSEISIFYQHKDQAEKDACEICREVARGS